MGLQKLRAVGIGVCIYLYIPTLHIFADKTGYLISKRFFIIANCCRHTNHSHTVLSKLIIQNFQHICNHFFVLVPKKGAFVRNILKTVYWKNIITTRVGEWSYTDNGLYPLAEYSYFVVAHDENMYSTASNIPHLFTECLRSIILHPEKMLRQQHRFQLWAMA